MKKKLCLVVDVPNWAFDNIAKKIQKELNYEYDIYIEYFNRRTESEYFFEFIEKLNQYDFIHFLNRRILLLYNDETFKHKATKNEKNIKEYIARNKEKFSTVVCDHIDLEPENIEQLKPIYNEYTKMYYTSSKKLFEIYSSIKEYKKPTTIIHDICDETIFKPINLERFNYDNISKRKLIIGWVGNSIHSGEKEIDLKGFHTIIKPVIQELKKEGYKIEEYYADRNEKWRLTHEMPDYYSQIDLCLCASIHEGTPLPIIEAMLCGIPIISTNVGIVEEAFGTKQKEFIIGDRQNGQNDKIIKEKLKQQIIYLYNNREKLQELSKENLESINKFDGGKTINEFKHFLEKCLNNK